MRVIICGSPHWNYNRYVEDEIVRLLRQSRLEGKHLLVIHGAEPGPEVATQEICNALGIDQVIYPANRYCGDKTWSRRNQIMLQEHSVDLVLLFSHDIKHSTVVNDMLRRAETKGIKTKLIDWDYLTKRNSSDIDVRPVRGSY